MTQRALPTGTQVEKESIQRHCFELAICGVGIDLPAGDQVGQSRSRASKQARVPRGLRTKRAGRRHVPHRDWARCSSRRPACSSLLRPDVVINKVALKIFRLIPAYVGLRGTLAEVG